MLQLVLLKAYTSPLTRSPCFFRLSMDHHVISLRRSQDWMHIAPWCQLKSKFWLYIRWALKDYITWNCTSLWRPQIFHGWTRSAQENNTFCMFPPLYKNVSYGVKEMLLFFSSLVVLSSNCVNLIRNLKRNFWTSSAPVPSIPADSVFYSEALQLSTDENETFYLSLASKNCIFYVPELGWRLRI
jgi:hypothetical protein